MRPAELPAYSYKEDASVPLFDDAGIVLVMDGDCALCSAAARRIACWDHADEVRIATVASPLGAALLAHYRLDPEDPATWLLLHGGRAHGSLEAMLYLFPRLKRWLWPLRVLGLLPYGVQDWLYGLVARNRYRIWGRGDMCALPDAALKKRLIT